MPNIIVCVKQVPEEAEIGVDSETRAPILERVPLKISEFDKNALEEAIRIKERLSGKVTVLSVGPTDLKKVVTKALAMGADEAYMVIDEALSRADALVISEVISRALKKIGEFDLIICGEASSDVYSFQIGPRLSELLGLPAITYVKSLKIEGSRVIAERDLEDATEVVEVEMPVIVTVTKEINEPRYPSARGLMMAARKKKVTWNLSDLGISVDQAREGAGIVVTNVEAPLVERRRAILKGDPAEVAGKLVEELRKEGVLG